MTRSGVSALALAAGLLVVIALGSALAAAARLADRRAGRQHPTVELVVDARVRVGRVRPIWDEVNLWKLHSFFGADRPDPATWWGPGWMRRHVPWARYARLLAALGGNYAPSIAPWCDYAISAPEHPDVGTHECGREGKPGPAAQNELVRDLDGQRITDYAALRTAIARVLESGVLPHLNLSAAPAVFTGAATDFTHYHWNAAPVRDFAGWRAFVAGAFEAVSDLGPGSWRVSILNEPNCLTLVGWEQEVRHVGFAGTPEEYARTFADGAAAVRAAAPGVRIHAGNYVTSVTFPAEDNLRPYLAALRAALAAGGLRWEDFWASSVSLYETPDTSVYDFVPVRLARLASAIAAAGLASRPVKVDELDIHPAIAAAFERAEGQSLDRTLYAASWHAEALRAFIVAGNVVSVAPWLTRMFDLATFAPYPKARVYELMGVLAGQLRAGGANDVVTERTARAGGLPRVAVAGEDPSPEVRPLHPKRAARVGALATRSPDGVRVLVIHHQNMPVADAAPGRRRHVRVVRVVARNVAPGAYVIRRLSIGSGGTAWDGATTPLRWQDDGCRVARSGTIEIAPPQRMEANSLWLFEATRRHRCPDPGP